MSSDLFQQLSDESATLSPPSYLLHVELERAAEDLCERLRRAESRLLHLENVHLVDLVEKGEVALGVENLGVSEGDDGGDRK